MGARNLGRGLLYRTARLHRPAESILLESIPGLLKSLKIPPQISWEIELWWGGMEAFLHPPPHPFLQQASGEIFEDDVNGFSSIADICFMVYCVSGIINYDFG